jgi:arylsulfatase A-like enzyme
MRTTIAIIAAAGSLAAAGCSQDAARRETEQTFGAGARPNVVLVLFEDMSPRVGAYGDDVARTPNFDRIAREGVRYTNAFTTSGVCAPSRAALITGRYQQTIGAQHMRTHGVMGAPGGGPQDYYAVPPEEVKAFPEILRASGYFTTNDYKTDYQFGEPFTVWDASQEGADWTGRNSGQPFFSMITLLTSHESFVWPADMEASTPLEKAVVARNAKVFADRKPGTDPADVEVPPYLPDLPEVRRDIATHYDNIETTDAQLGLIYKKLEEAGLLDDTILIVSTDHGDGLPRAKRSLYDSGLHVPLVIRYPDGFRAGEVEDELLSFVDLAPTILSWAGTKAPEWMHGRDLVGPDRDPPRDYVFAAQDRMDNDPNLRRAVRDERFKYIRNDLDGDPYFSPLPFRDAMPTMKALWAGYEAGDLPPDGAALFEPLPRVQLYDTLSDPYEVENLVGDPRFAEVEARLEAALEAWQQRVGDMSAMPEADMIELMWPEGVQPVTEAPVAAMEPVGEAVLIALSSPTPGASIGYRLNGEDGWDLYHQPLEVPQGMVIEAKAVRYGYAESQPVEIRAVPSPR